MLININIKILISDSILYLVVFVKYVKEAFNRICFYFYFNISNYLFIILMLFYLKTNIIKIAIITISNITN